MTQAASSLRERVLADIRAANDLAVHHSSLGLAGYLNHVVVDSRPEPRKFLHLADPWQWALLGKVLPAIENVCGFSQAPYSGPRRFLWILPRGHDKTTSLGRLVNWALAFSNRKIYCLGAAGDRDQASRLAEFMRTEASLNPWLDSRLEFANYVVRSKQNGSRLQIISADAKSSFGDKSDIVICDELTHWEKSDLWDALYSGSEKRPDSVYLIITNAGILGSWQHEVLRMAQNFKNWFVYEAPGPIASWMSPQGLAELALTLPKPIADRVLFNKWLDPAAGCSFVTKEQVFACEGLGVRLGLTFRTCAFCDGILYCASIDYGPTKDRTVLVVGHRNPDGVVVVDHMTVLQGSPESPVSIEAVEAWMTDVHKQFRNPLFVIDNYQLESSYQKFVAKGYRIEKFETRGGKGNYELAQNLSVLIANAKLAWYPGCGTILAPLPYRGLQPHSFSDELREVVLKPTSYGFRIDHDLTKHDDRVVGVGMMALGLVKQAQGLEVNWDGDRWW